MLPFEIDSEWNSKYNYNTINKFRYLCLINLGICYITLKVTITNIIYKYYNT